MALLGIIGTVAGAAKNFFSGFSKEARAERKAQKAATKLAIQTKAENIAANIASGAAASNPDILQTKSGVKGAFNKVLAVAKANPIPTALIGAVAAYMLFFKNKMGAPARRRLSPQKRAALAKARAARARKARAKR